MSKKKVKAVAKASATREGFVPSDGTEGYLQDADGKKLLKETSLQELVIVIESTYATGLSFAQKATQEMMKCGGYLQEARDKFKGDNEFGKWRAKHISFSQSYCQRLMAVNKEFGGNDDAKLLPIGTLSELLPASPKLKADVIAEVKDGKKVTRQDVKDKKAAEKGDVSHPESGNKTPEVAGKPTKVDKKAGPVIEIDFAGEAQVYLDKQFVNRLDELEVRGKHGDIINAWIIFGIPPYHEGMPSIDSIHALWHALGVDDSQWLEENPDQKQKFQQAYDMLIALY